MEKIQLFQFDVKKMADMRSRFVIHIIFDVLRSDDNRWCGKQNNKLHVYRYSGQKVGVVGS